MDDALNFPAYATRSWPADSLTANASKMVSAASIPDFMAVWEPLILAKFKRAGITPNQQATRKVHLRQGLKPPFCDGARAVADARATAQILLVKRVMLELLKLIKRRKVGIAIVEIHDLPNDHRAVFQVIHEGAALGATLGQWPSSAMNHKPGNMLLSRDFPDFLDAQPVVLGIGLRHRGDTV